VSGVEVTSRRLGDRLAIRVAGEVDFSNVDALHAVLDDVPADVRTVVLDLTGLDFMDSMALAAILEADMRAEQRGAELRLICGAAARRVIDAAGLDGRLAVEEPDGAA
jgi:anti-anti-sigma factor